jgi:hypothetical protein
MSVTPRILLLVTTKSNILGVTFICSKLLKNAKLTKWSGPRLDYIV